MRLLQSLSRGLQTIDFLCESNKPLRLTAIAKELDVGKSNASHIMKTLVACGYATQDDARHYSAAPKAYTKANEHTLSEVVACKEDCRPALKTLVEKTKECAHLAVLVGNRVWYIDKVDSALPLKVDHPIGSLSPLHCTALGKAFLAFGNIAMPPLLPAFTPKTITDKDALQKEITITRTRGYAIDDEEYAQGIRCAARPVFQEKGQMIAAIGVSGPSVRIDDDRLKELGTMVHATMITLRKL